MHEVLVNCLGGLSLPRKSVVRLTDRPDMTLDVYRGLKQQYNNNNNCSYASIENNFALPEYVVEFGTHKDLIACTPPDIIKPETFLEIPLGHWRGEMVKMSKNYFFLLFSISKKICLS